MKRPRKAESAHRFASRPVGQVQPTVLVVEREPRLGVRLQQALHGTRWHVEATTQGREALASFRSRAITVCVVEDTLLDMSGIDLVRRLANDHPETRFIVVGEPTFTERALASVANSIEAHLEYPIDNLDHAIDVIARALQRRGEQWPRLVREALSAQSPTSAPPPVPPPPRAAAPAPAPAPAKEPKKMALMRVGDPATNALAFASRDPSIVSRTTALLATAAAMADAKGRDEIGDIFNTFLRAHYGSGLILICRKGLLLGWKGFAPGIDESLLESVVVPLKEETMFRAAFKRKGIVVGPPPPDVTTLHARLWKMLGCEPPVEVAIAPVMLQQRVVALVYVHGVDGGFLPPTTTVELTSLSAVMEASFTRLIQLSKRPAEDQAPAPA